MRCENGRECFWIINLLTLHKKYFLAGCGLIRWEANWGALGIKKMIYWVKIFKVIWWPLICSWSIFWRFVIDNFRFFRIPIIFFEIFRMKKNKLSLHNVSKLSQILIFIIILVSNSLKLNVFQSKTFIFTVSSHFQTIKSAGNFISFSLLSPTNKNLPRL